MTDALSSDTVVVQVSTAAAAMAGSISGSTTFTKEASGGTPRLMDASSMESGRLNSVDEALRTPNGSRRTM
ncbi:hypothetical protein D3C78_1929790 [compost metagenome]